MNSRLYDRIAALVSLLLLGGLGLLTYYLAVVAERQTPQALRRADSIEPDYFVEGLAMVRTDRNGAPSFRLEAERLRHRPQDDTTEFIRPRVVSLDPGQPRVVVIADTGRIDNDGSRTELSGNVVISRAATPRGEALRAETEWAEVLPEQDLIRTDRPVRITRGGSLLTGVGMALDNKTRQLQVDSKVQAVWQAPAPAAPSQDTVLPPAPSTAGRFPPSQRLAR